MLQKPKIGQPCNQCGLCCKIQVCRNGAYIQKLVRNLGETVEGPCPALINKSDGTFGCGIYINPKKYIKNSPYREEVLRREFGNLIGAGNGCDEIGYDDDPEEEAKLDKLYHESVNNPEKIKKYKNSIRIIHNLNL